MCASHNTSQPKKKHEAHLTDIDLNPHVFQCLHEYGPSGGERHQWEDEAITISGTTKGIETKDAKNDRVIKGKEVVQPTLNPDIAWNHMSLINQTNINPSSFLQRPNMLIGESSRKRGKSPRAPNRGVKRTSKRLANKQPSNCVSDSGIRNYNRMFWLKNSPMDAVKLWDLAKNWGLHI
ncbi:hypothetical protein VNO80_06649 [Phaseolus coccineus]|uniref:Uncharacterized protein n=1 Tax=Phaseolus coccineus TaxID=3886 RepID=A0AAN9RIW9_PHACN